MNEHKPTSIRRPRGFRSFDPRGLCRFYQTKMLDENLLAIYRRLKLPLVACRGKAYFAQGPLTPTPYDFLFEWPRQIGLLCGCPWEREEPQGLANGRVFTPSKLIVMDVDPRNGGDESLAKLVARFGPLPYTAKQSTPSGGAHYFFAAPQDLEFPHDLADFDLPGIDIIADQRHFVLLAPSTFKRKPYVWEVPLWEVVADCPEHLMVFARAWSKKDEERPSVPHIERTAAKSQQPLGVRGRANGKPREVVTDPRRYKALLADLIRRFPITKGRRDNQTARAVGSLVGRGYLSEPILYAYLKHFKGEYKTPINVAFAKAKRMMHRMPEAAITNHIEETMKRDLELTDDERALIERAGSRSQHGFLRAVVLHRKYRKERDQRKREEPQGLVNGRVFTPLNQHAATNQAWQTLMRDLGYGWPSDVTIEKHKRRFITRKGSPAKEFEVLVEKRKGLPGVPSLYADGAVWMLEDSTV